MPKKVSAPPELVNAAEAALNEKMPVRKATELLKYLMFESAIKRADGNESAAALTLGMSRSALNQNRALLEARLA